MARKFKIKKGDQVVVITGRDKGKKGEVLEVLRAESRVRVQGVNMVKRHRRATQNDAGGIISILLVPMPPIAAGGIASIIG